MAEAYDLNKFYRGAKTLGVSLTGEQADQFVLYYEMLTEWNRKMNLTTIVEWEDVVTKHFLDSLSLVKAVPDLADQRLADIGTGAGFPGIPIKIAFPRTDLVLVDSVNKKLDFVRAAVDELRLPGVTAVHGRAEDLAHETDFRQRFDICVSRAVSKLGVLAEYCLPFVRVGGCFVAYKGGNVKAECADAEKAVFLLGGETESIVNYMLPETDEERTLIRIKKKENTPRAYPRKAGTPSRDPL